MYDTILLTLDGTPTDRAIIEHVKQLAKLAHSRLVLLHVADGWAARTYGRDAVSPEIAEDTAYLEKIRAEFQSLGIPVALTAAAFVVGLLLLPFGVETKGKPLPA